VARRRRSPPGGGGTCSHARGEAAISRCAAAAAGCGGSKIATLMAPTFDGDAVPSARRLLRGESAQVVTGLPAGSPHYPRAAQRGVVWLKNCPKAETVIQIMINHNHAGIPPVTGRFGSLRPEGLRTASRTILGWRPEIDRFVSFPKDLPSEGCRSADACVDSRTTRLFLVRL
jgi:hypothetical protein